MLTVCGLGSFSTEVRNCRLYSGGGESGTVITNMTRPHACYWLHTNTNTLYIG